MMTRLDLMWASQQTAQAVADADGNCEIAKSRFDMVANAKPKVITCKVTGQVVTIHIEHAVDPLVPGLPDGIILDGRALMPEAE